MGFLVDVAFKIEETTVKRDNVTWLAYHSISRDHHGRHDDISLRAVKIAYQCMPAVSPRDLWIKESLSSGFQLFI